MTRHEFDNEVILNLLRRYSRLIPGFEFTDNSGHDFYDYSVWAGDIFVSISFGVVGDVLDEDYYPYPDHYANAVVIERRGYTDDVWWSHSTEVLSLSSLTAILDLLTTNTFQSEGLFNKVSTQFPSVFM